MNIYNPLEAGFSSTNGPTVCPTAGYYCAGEARLLVSRRAFGCVTHVRRRRRPRHVPWRTDLDVLRVRRIVVHGDLLQHGHHFWGPVQGPRQVRWLWGKKKVWNRTTIHASQSPARIISTWTCRASTRLTRCHPRRRCAAYLFFLSSFGFVFFTPFPSFQVTSHSPLVGVALDGKGIYGAWEAAGALPALDACGGHVGTTSGTTSTAVGAVTGFLNTNYVASSVYHYHLSGALWCQITFFIVLFSFFSLTILEFCRLVPVHARLLRLRRHRPGVARPMPSAVPGHGA